MRPALSTLVLVTALVTASACGGEDPASTPAVPYRTLAEYGLFVGTGATQQPAPGVVPYDVNAPLFSDHTTKHRFLRLPAGARITFDSRGRWRFPRGTVLVKTFAYPRDARDPSRGERLLETRLLIMGEQDFAVHTYVWNEAQTEAVRLVAGRRVPVTWTDEGGRARSIDYLVPNTNQCAGCHGEQGRSLALGVRTRQLDRPNDYGAGAVNQLDHLAALGAFDGALPPASERERMAPPSGDGPVEARARAYLDANCGHCHNDDPTAPARARSSGLYLNFESRDPSRLGVCRVPVAPGDTGGRRFDIVPGHPEQSALVYRMASEDPNIKMPEMPTQLSDAAGVDLISRWIAAMRPEGCP